MKINRHTRLKESYKITSDWMDEFAKNLAKEANLEYLDVGDRHRIVDNSKKFRTIDAKMADIKKRIGYDLLDQHRVKEAKASHSCECVKEASCGCNIKTAKEEHSKENIEAMRQILDYICGIIEHESHLDSLSVINRCREEEGLDFRELPINLEKLTEWIETKLSDDQYDVKYVPPEPIPSGDAEDNRAEYYQHAEPTI